MLNLVGWLCVEGTKMPLDGENEHAERSGPTGALSTAYFVCENDGRDLAA